MPRKLILKCGLSPGDIVMLTAAVRDLHLCYPGKFLTDVRTSCIELWDANPFITDLLEDDPEAEIIECSYPLINRCSRTPYHCLHGFVEFLNDHLRLSIRPTAFRGDIHLSSLEKSWYSQVHEFTGVNTPFWIVAAGGKHDLTIKWWQTERYQEVINHFKRKIQFVQVGELGHYHPKLEGVIDLRGRTTIRELVRLVYHSQGVLCSVTSAMHLSAAVPSRLGRPTVRPCVVVAGGREPAHWEAYPGHQFIHTNGALTCAPAGGCWKSRTIRLRDGNKRDRSENLCVNVVNELPRCMDMITPKIVIQRIESYFEGGAVKYLSKRQATFAAKGVIASAENDYDEQPLDIHFAGMALEKHIRQIPPFPAERFHGRGIVICVGGAGFFVNAWVCINMIRQHGCNLPIELWHLGRNEMSSEMKGLVKPLGVECVDAQKLRKKFPVRRLFGWHLKPFALLHCCFREILLLDADNVVVRSPEFLFETSQFRETGAIFWPDTHQKSTKNASVVWRSSGLGVPSESEFESGQIVLDKQRCWAALHLSLWINANSDFYCKYFYGDKETFHLAFRKLTKSFSLIETPAKRIQGTICQHDFEGRRIFQHRNSLKWDLFPTNPIVKDFWFEKECRKFLHQLRQRWQGGMPAKIKSRLDSFTCPILPETKRIKAVIISCEIRNEVRRETLNNLARTDWMDEPIVELDDGLRKDSFERQLGTAARAIERGIEENPDYILFLEDDLQFNRHLRHNLLKWSPLKAGMVTLASLYNPGIQAASFSLTHNARIIHPHSIFGSQAFLLEKETAKYLLRNWAKGEPAQDITMSRLAGNLRKPIFYHAPSLVQHVGLHSTWGGPFHKSADFDAVWKA